MRVLFPKKPVDIGMRPTYASSTADVSGPPVGSTKPVINRQPRLPNTQNGNTLKDPFENLPDDIDTITIRRAERYDCDSWTCSLEGDYSAESTADTPAAALAEALDGYWSRIEEVEVEE